MPLITYLYAIQFRLVLREVSA